MVGKTPLAVQMYRKDEEVRQRGRVRSAVGSVTKDLWCG